jgi:hypothetical protein
VGEIAEVQFIQIVHDAIARLAPAHIAKARNNNKKYLREMINRIV